MSDGIYGWARFLTLIDVVVAIYVAITGSIGLAVALLEIAAFIYLTGLWSRRTHRRYGEDTGGRARLRFSAASVSSASFVNAGAADYSESPPPDPRRGDARRRDEGVLPSFRLRASGGSSEL
jgi:hypothetical protein